MSDTLVPEPQASIFDSVAKALGNDEAAARRVMLNPNLAKGFKDGKPVEIDQPGCGALPLLHSGVSQAPYHITWNAVNEMLSPCSA